MRWLLFLLVIPAKAGIQLLLLWKIAAVVALARPIHGRMTSHQSLALEAFAGRTGHVA